MVELHLLSDSALSYCSHSFSSSSHDQSSLATRLFWGHPLSQASSWQRAGPRLCSYLWTSFLLIATCWLQDSPSELCVASKLVLQSETLESLDRQMSIVSYLTGIGNFPCRVQGLNLAQDPTKSGCWTIFAYSRCVLCMNPVLALLIVFQKHDFEPSFSLDFGLSSLVLPNVEWFYFHYLKFLIKDSLPLCIANCLESSFRRATRSGLFTLRLLPPWKG